MLKIQEFLECFDSIIEASRFLKKNLHVELSPFLIDGTHYVFLAQPKQKADLTHPIVKETNLLLLDENGDVLAKAWDFPTIAHGPKDIPTWFDFGNANYSEEMPDGDLIVIYNIEGTWYVETGDSPIGVGNPTFDHEKAVITLLEKRFGRWDKAFKNVNPFLCFVFCFVHPDNKKIMPIISPELYLMAIINLENSKELSYNTVDTIGDEMGFTRPPSVEINGTNSFMHHLNKMRTFAPGLMLRDKMLNRVFIPNPIYLAMKKALDAGPEIRPGHVAGIVQACRDEGDIDGISMSYYYIAPMLNLLWRVKKELWTEMLDLWAIASRKPSMQEFAKIVQYHPLNFLLFLQRDNKIPSIKDGLDRLTPMKMYSVAKRREPREYSVAVKKLKEYGG